MAVELSVYQSETEGKIGIDIDQVGIYAMHCDSAPAAMNAVSRTTT